MNPPLLIAWKLDGRPALVVGGGSVAIDRVRSLLGAGAAVRLVAPEVDPALVALAEAGTIDVVQRPFADGDVEGCAVVLGATSDPEASSQVAAACSARGIPVNVADVPDLCDFYFAAVHRDGPLQIAVSTSGRAPGLASRIRDRIARDLPLGLASGIARFGVLRDAVRRADPDAPPGRRMAFLREWLRQRELSSLAALDETGVAEAVEAYRGSRWRPTSS